MGDKQANPIIDSLSGAFAKDGFAVNKDSDVFVYNGKIGIVAAHTSATIGSTGLRKKVYYDQLSYHLNDRFSEQFCGKSAPW